MTKERFIKDFNGEKIFSLEYDKETLKDMVIEKQEEIERLNNIINELEIWLKERIEKLDINGYDDDVFNGIELALQKLKELKGSDRID